jgi:lysophospholipase L1-like esterase
MLSGLVCTAVSAEESEQKIYRYVALGDSISGGFGLENESGIFFEDPALFLTEERIAKPIRSAYPALFGEKLAALGEENGYAVSATNLSTAGYLAEDVKNTILEDGHYSEFLMGIFAFMGEIEENPMDNYHEIFSRYIPDADLVSIQLGGNDILSSFFDTMGYTENPILLAIYYPVMMTLIGTDIQTSLQTGMQVLEAGRDSITYETVIEAAVTIKAMVDRIDECVDEVSQDVGSIIDAARTVNDKADFAVINMYNPFGNSLELDGKTRDIKTVICDIFARSAEYAAGLDENADKETITANLKAIVSDELAYPLQYLLAGKTIDKTIKKLNDALEDVAESKGALYVDVYDISNECNLDPHPVAQGHEEIAEILYDAAYNTAAAKMGIEVDAEVCGDSDGDGKISILDATRLQRMLAKICDRDGSTFSGRILKAIEKKILDVDGDGEITILDATVIQRHIAAIVICRNIGKPIV